METKLADWMQDHPEGKEAEAILRACVHCGFCTATCPTYQVLGDELDGPRGRIYLVKQLLEGASTSAKTRLHLDRCLSCRACETTCPSGVRYHRLLDIGRQVMTERLPRPAGQRWVRQALAAGLTQPRRFALALAFGRLLRPLLPAFLRRKIPPLAPGLKRQKLRGARAQQDLSARPAAARRVLLLAGCVQPALAPSINLATRHVLALLGIQAVEAPKAGCCGAVRFHLDAQAAALEDMRALIDRWWPFIADGDAGRAPKVEAIIVTASGCGAHLKDYGALLRHDAAYADKAARISALSCDVGAFLMGEGGTATNASANTATTAATTSSPVTANDLETLEVLLRAVSAQGHKNPPLKVAVHTPCTLQHALKRRGDIERLLRLCGAEFVTLTPVGEAHLCCGSAGTYSVLQPAMAGVLRERKLTALGARGGSASTSPDLVVTANIGCLSHLQSTSDVPVRHWIELLSDRLAMRENKES